MLCALIREKHAVVIPCPWRQVRYVNHFGLKTQECVQMPNEQYKKGLVLAKGLKTHSTIWKSHKPNYTWKFVKLIQTLKLVNDHLSIESHGLWSDLMREILFVVILTQKWNMYFKQSNAFIRRSLVAPMYMYASKLASCQLGIMV